MFLYFAAPKNLPPGAKDPPSPPLAAALDTYSGTMLANEYIFVSTFPWPDFIKKIVYAIECTLLIELRYLRPVLH